MRIVFVIILSIAALLIGCAASQNPKKEKSKKPQVNLEETKWYLHQINGEDFDDERTDLHLTLSNEKTATGNLGCNRFQSKYQLTEEALLFGPVSRTKRGCPILKTEKAFMEALRNTNTYKIKGTTLHLMKDSEVLAVFQTVPTASRVQK